MKCNGKSLEMKAYSKLLKKYLLWTELKKNPTPLKYPKKGKFLWKQMMFKHKGAGSIFHWN